MTASIKVLSGTSSGKVHAINVDQAVLGRNTFCDIVIPEHSISRQHARIVREGDRYFIEDMDSLNGTFVNGVRVVGRTELNHDDRIHLYEVLLSFDDGRPVAPSGQTVHGPALPRAEPVPPSVMSDEQRRQTTIVNTLDATMVPRVDVGSEEKLRAVLGITRNLGQSLALDTFLPNVLDSVFEIFPQAERGYVLLADRPGGPLQPAAIKDKRSETGSSLTLAPISRTIAARVMSEGKAILSADSDDTELASSVLGESASSMMTVPLVGPSNTPLGIIHIDTTDADNRFCQDDLEVLISVATVAGQAVEHARVHQDSIKLDRRQRELSTARQVQLHFLPQNRPDVAGYKFFDYYRAADDVGGDYFGYVSLPDGRWAIAVGDVSGKGVSAALMMARLCSEVRYCLVTTGSPVEAVVRLNRDLIDPTLEDRFITFLLAVLDPASHSLSIVNAGHMPPILRRYESGEVEQIGVHEAGPPLGFDPESQFGSATVVIQPGDTVTMYTDGISEATSADEQVFGIKQLCKVIGSGPTDPERQGQLVLSEVDRFVAGQPQTDDICLLVFGRPRRG